MLSSFCPVFLTAAVSRSYCTTCTSGRKSLTVNCIKTVLLIDECVLHGPPTSSTNTFLQMLLVALVRACAVRYDHVVEPGHSYADTA